MMESRVDVTRTISVSQARGGLLRHFFGRPDYCVGQQRGAVQPSLPVPTSVGPFAGQQLAAAPVPELRFFHVETHAATRLLFDQSNGTVLHGDPARDGLGPVVACIPVDRPDICLLAAGEDTGLALRLDNDGETERVISLRVVPLDGRAWSLAHPVTGLFLCAEPGGHVVANRTALGPWESFVLSSAAEVAPATLAGFQAVARHLPATASARAALAAIAGVTEGWELRPLLRTLRPGDVDWLGRLLRRDPTACKGLARLYPADIWARLALPDLATANTALRPVQAAAEPPGFVREIDTSFDLLAPLASLDKAGRWQSFPQACSIFARRDRDPSRTVCLLTTARDEGPYLIEWLAFHRLLGVDDFFIYSNDLGDGSDELLRILAESGILNWTSSVTAPGVSPQYKAYGHALQVMPDILDFRWAGFIDLDEFVVLNSDIYSSLPAFLAAHETTEVDAIALNWVLFGSNGLLRRDDALVTERFTTRDPVVNAHIKSFLRPHRFVHAMPHHPYPDRSVRPVIRSASGADHPLSPFSPAPEDEHAFIAHYYSKSAEEHLLRRSMSRADLMLGTDVSPAMFGSAVAQRFLDQHRRGGVPDDRAARHLPSVRVEMARLRALPGVEAALARIDVRYHERLRTLARLMESDPRFRQPGTAEQWFAELVQDAGSRNVVAERTHT